MNSTLEPLRNGTRLTGLVALLAFASAISIAGCHAHAVGQGASELMSIAVTSASEPVVTNTFVGVVPVHPFDERPVTPVETAGASASN
jgi:hypothetical protein